tara:strand:+ start:1117 stop:2073 length:957 start_codon:yes stop_codon:yes gene_type:complete
MKPNFIIGGGRRCGSTFLYHLLNSHSSVGMYKYTDNSFFIDKDIASRKTWMDGQVIKNSWNKTKNEYYNRFNELSNNKIIGEKCADILHWKPSHARLKSIAPDIKIIIQLRNPIHRAFSQYNNELYKGREWLSFAEAIQSEKERSEKSDYAKYHLGYIRGSKYYNLIKSLLKNFGENQIMITIFEETINDYQNLANNLFSFLNLNQSVKIDFSELLTNKNINKIERREVFKSKIFDSLIKKNNSLIKIIASKLIKDGQYVDTSSRRKIFYHKYNKIMYKNVQVPKIDNTFYYKLFQYFKKDINNLEKLIGRDLSVWKI